MARPCATRNASNKDYVCEPTIPAGINRPPPSKTISPVTRVPDHRNTRLSWAGFGGIFSCLSMRLCPRFSCGTCGAKCSYASPILVRLLCKYPSRIGGIPFCCLLLTLCPHLRVKFVVTLHFCPFKIYISAFSLRNFQSNLY